MRLGDGAELTAQEIRGGVWRGMGAVQLPIKIILLPLAELAEAGVRVIVERTARCWKRKRGVFYACLSSLYKAMGMYLHFKHTGSTEKTSG